MVAQLVSNLHLPLSRIRLETYRPPNGSDVDMVTNYFWDMALAEALLPTLHGVELALRNSLHTHLTTFHKTSANQPDPLWFYRPSVLEPGQLGQLSGALRQLSDRKTQPSDGHIVAELTFGFWVTLISDPYQQRFWQPNGYALMRAVFPNSTKLKRQDIHRRYNAIRHLRNRVSHHEAIWDRSNLSQEHADVCEAIRWISPPFEKAINAIDRFPTILANRSTFQTDLRTRLGI